MTKQIPGLLQGRGSSLGGVSIRHYFDGITRGKGKNPSQISVRTQSKGHLVDMGFNVQAMQAITGYSYSRPVVDIGHSITCNVLDFRRAAKRHMANPQLSPRETATLKEILKLPEVKRAIRRDRMVAVIRAPLNLLAKLTGG